MWHQFIAELLKSNRMSTVSVHFSFPIVFVLLWLVAITTVGSTSQSFIKRTICFHTHDVNERGVDVAIFDYADFMETILNHTSKIIIPDIGNLRNGTALPKYMKRFGTDNVVFYKTGTQPGKSLPMEAKKVGCELIYIQKAGDKLGIPRYPDAFNYQ